MAQEAELERNKIYRLKNLENLQSEKSSPFMAEMKANNIIIT